MPFFRGIKEFFVPSKTSKTKDKAQKRKENRTTDNQEKTNKEGFGAK